MNRKIKISLGFILCVMIVGGGIWGISKGNTAKKEISQEAKKTEILEEKAEERLELNPLSLSASGESVSKVKIGTNSKKIFGKKAKAYKVENHKYSEKEINKVAKSLKTKIKTKNKLSKNIKEYDLEDGGYLEYYESTGSLSYISQTDVDTDMKHLDKKIDENKCKEIAETFITSSEVIELDNLEFVKGTVCETMETSTGTFPLTYMLYYTKKSPEDNINFYGVGPGIKIEINKDYSIRNFVSVDKNIMEINGNYNTISEKEAVDKICNGSDVQINGTSEGEEVDVAIDKAEICLYSDPISLEQEYMAPYYVLHGEDEYDEDITIVLPAIEDSMITYKK